MEGKFDVMYMNRPSNKHDEWSEEKQSKIKSHKKGRSQHTMDCENSTGSSGSVKCLTLSSHMRSVIFTYCGMSNADIKKLLGSTISQTRGPR